MGVGSTSNRNRNQTGKLTGRTDGVNPEKACSYLTLPHSPGRFPDRRQSLCGGLPQGLSTR